MRKVHEISDFTHCFDHRCDQGIGVEIAPQVGKAGHKVLLGARDVTLGAATAAALWDRDRGPLLQNSLLLSLMHSRNCGLEAESATE